MRRYTVGWSEPAIDLLKRLSDARIQAKLLEVADTLSDAPETRGKALRDEFAGYWSLHWSRYRIVYAIDHTARVVRIAAVGLRADGKAKDVYETARKLLSQGLLEPPPT